MEGRVGQNGPQLEHLPAMPGAEDSAIPSHQRVLCFPQPGLNSFVFVFVFPHKLAVSSTRWDSSRDL